MKKAANFVFATTKKSAKSAKKPRTNLNLAITNSGGQPSAVPRRNSTASLTNPQVKLFFHEISAALCEQIRSTPYVVGCMAWLSDPAVLAALAGCKGVSFVVTNDSLLNNATIRQQYEALVPLHLGTPAVQCVGIRKGQTRSLMHHKFCVGLDASRAPVWLAAGSYNASVQASNNLESLMIFACPTIARVYQDEFNYVHSLSKPLAKIIRKKK